MLFSQKKLAKLKRTEQRTEPHVYGRNAAVQQVMTHTHTHTHIKAVQKMGHSLFHQPQVQTVSSGLLSFNLL